MRTRTEDLRRSNLGQNSFDDHNIQQFQAAQGRQDLPPVQPTIVHQDAPARAQNVGYSPEVFRSPCKTVKSPNRTAHLALPIVVCSAARPAQINHVVPMAPRPWSFHRRVIGVHEQDLHGLGTDVARDWVFTGPSPPTLKLRPNRRLASTESTSRSNAPACRIQSSSCENEWTINWASFLGINAGDLTNIYTNPVVPGSSFRLRSASTLNFATVCHFC